MHTSETNLVKVLHLQMANERSNKSNIYGDNHQLSSRDLAELKRCSAKDDVVKLLTLDFGTCLAAPNKRFPYNMRFF